MATQEAPRFHVVAIDYGLKRNILRELATAAAGSPSCPATATAEEILERKPDGVFLSNGPGDPAATGVYAVPEIKKLVDSACRCSASASAIRCSASRSAARRRRCIRAITARTIR